MICGVLKVGVKGRLLPRRFTLTEVRWQKCTDKGKRSYTTRRKTGAQKNEASSKHPGYPPPLARRAGRGGGGGDGGGAVTLSPGGRR